MQQRREQLDLPIFGASGRDGVTDDLAVHGHRNQRRHITAVAGATGDRGSVGLLPQPPAYQRIRSISVDVVGDPTRRRLAGHHITPGERVSAASGHRQQLWREIHRPVGDLPEIAGTSQHREHHHRQHRTDAVPNSPRLARIGHASQQIHQQANPDQAVLHRRTRQPLSGDDSKGIRDMRH